MKRKRYSTKQIVAAIKQHELSMPAAELICKLGFAEQTFYRWKRKYAGLEPDQARELNQLREENARLKKLVVNLSLDKAMLSDVVKKVVKPSRRRGMVRYLQVSYDVSERRACKVVKVPSFVQRYRSVAEPHVLLRARIRELALIRHRYGYRRLYMLLRREGFNVGKAPVREATAPNEAWNMDFVSDQLHNGDQFRALTVIDVHTRECMAIESDQQLKGEDVVRVLNQLRYRPGAPKRMYCGNVSEFTSRILDLWAYHNQVTMEFSRPGKPTDNRHIKAFNGSFRDECRNAHWFTSLA